MPKLKPEVQHARREHILDAAEQCFARAGFHRTTMHDICKEAGVSPGALYVYFDSKEALIAGISERDRRSSPSGSMGSPPRRTSCRRCGSWASSISSRSRPRTIACASRSAWNPRATRASARSSSASTATSLESFEKLFQKMQDEGRIAPGARHPDRGEGVHGGGRRHVLAPRRRSRLRSHGGHAGGAAADPHAPQSGAAGSGLPIPTTTTRPRSRGRS